MKDYDLVVRIVDVSEDPKASKAGDVVDVRISDSVPYTPFEKQNPDWRIVRTQMLPSLAEALMAGPTEGQDKINKENRKRDWMVDVSLLPNASKFSGKQRDEIVEISGKDFLLAVKQKPNPLEE